MKYIFILIFLSSVIIGCKKEDYKPKETYHITITSTHQELKFLSFGSDKQRGFSTKVFETDFQVVAGEKIKVWTGFEQINLKPGRFVTVVITKGEKVLDNITQKETVYIAIAQ